VIKRIIDVVVAFGGLIFLSPLLILIAVAISITSPGPAIFRQLRIGKGGRPFLVLKFRSMSADAAATGPPLTIGDDKRVTQIGRFLRRTKLDELPQLVNVLRGDMSLVGPRPEVPKYVESYPPDVRDRVLSVRPGMTDEASLELIDEATILASAIDPEWTYVHELLPRKLEIYQRYVLVGSLRTDVRILTKTLLRVLAAVTGVPAFWVGERGRHSNSR
jgi:lipopolysaccharide/colanic/teichoic acid biosynthesis glycosyltransferase